MELFKDDNDLIAALRVVRPKPRAEFAAELDERAAAGFGRRSSSTGSPLGRLLTRLRTFSPGQMVLAGGAAALTAIVLATVIVAAGEPKTDSASLAQLSPTDHPAHAQEEQTFASGASGSGNPSSLASKPSPGSGSAGVQYEAAVPAVTGNAHAPATYGNSSGTSAAGVESSGPSRGSGPFASHAGHRDVERSAEMVLGADPADIGADAAKVFDAVHTAGGIVLSSSVRGGTPGQAGARFDLLIPAAKLGDALAAFSDIDVVVSRHEATEDITAATVSAGEHLQDSVAKIDGLLVQLAGADTESERAEVEAELRTERRHAAALRASLTKLNRRANLSRVSLRIETDSGATSNSADSNWDVGDALGDVGHILTISAGVTIVGLAILAPLALIAWLAWFANRVRIRRSRRRVVG